MPTDGQKIKFFGVFASLDTQGPTIRSDFFLPEICLCQNQKKKKIVKEFAKEMSKLWAPVVVHRVVRTPDRQNIRFLRFFALFGAQKPNSGVEIFPKKKNFFLRFFDFLTRRWPIQNALVVQKMAGE